HMKRFRPSCPRPRSVKVRTGRRRLLVECLEERTLLSNGQWLAVIDGIAPTDNTADQAPPAQNPLHPIGLRDQDVPSVQAIDLSGTFVVQTPLGVTQQTLTGELQQVPGFSFVEDYTPDGADGQAQDDGGDLIDLDYYEQTYGPFDYETFLRRE